MTVAQWVDATTNLAMVPAVGNVGEEIQTGEARRSGRLVIVLGGELRSKKIKDREGGGASDFDGFC
jgi:hypothetical protein